MARKAATPKTDETSAPDGAGNAVLTPMGEATAPTQREPETTNLSNGTVKVDY